MKKYYKIEITNGYCGCDEVEIIAEDEKIDVFMNTFDYLQNYSFYEPDERFIGHEEDYESEEDYQLAYEEYQDNCEVSITELTKEEYIEECENYCCDVDESVLK